MAWDLVKHKDDFTLSSSVFILVHTTPFRTQC